MSKKKLFGYCREAVKENMAHLEFQKNEMIELGVPKDNIFMDFGYKTNQQRYGLQSCLESLKKESTLYIYSLDRIGFKNQELQEILDFLDDLSIDLYIIEGPWGEPINFFPFVKESPYQKIHKLFYEAYKNLQNESLYKKVNYKKASAIFNKSSKKENLAKAIEAVYKNKTSFRDALVKYNIKYERLFYYISTKGNIKTPGRKFLNIR